MGVHGSLGAGASTLPAAARLAAMSCCAPQPTSCDDEPARERQQRRSSTTQLQQPGHQPHPGHGRLEQALLQLCRPGMQTLLPQPPLLGGGPTPPASARAIGRAPDPTTAALIALLADTTATDAEPSLLRQLSGQLAAMLGTSADKVRSLLAALRPGGDAPARGADAGSLPAAPRADAPAPALALQPPPPPGPTLTLDPALGVIVDVTRPGSSDEPGNTPSLPGDDPDDGKALPSSWVPVPGRLRHGVRAGIGALVDHIDALLAEVGISRLQLLLLTIVAPLAVAFGIEVATSILAGE